MTTTGDSCVPYGHDYRPLITPGERTLPQPSNEQRMKCAKCGKVMTVYQTMSAASNVMVISGTQIP